MQVDHADPKARVASSQALSNESRVMDSEWVEVNTDTNADGTTVSNMTDVMASTCLEHTLPSTILTPEKSPTSNSSSICVLHGENSMDVGQNRGVSNPAFDAGSLDMEKSLSKSTEFRTRKEANKVRKDECTDRNSNDHLLEELKNLRARLKGFESLDQICRSKHERCKSLEREKSILEAELQKAMAAIQAKPGVPDDVVPGSKTTQDTNVDITPDIVLMNESTPLDGQLIDTALVSKCEQSDPNQYREVDNINSDEEAPNKITPAQPSAMCADEMEENIAKPNKHVTLSTAKKPQSSSFGNTKFTRKADTFSRHNTLVDDNESSDEENCVERTEGKLSHLKKRRHRKHKQDIMQWIEEVERTQRDVGGGQAGGLRRFMPVVQALMDDQDCEHGLGLELLSITLRLVNWQKERNVHQIFSDTLVMELESKKKEVKELEHSINKLRDENLLLASRLNKVSEAAPKSGDSFPPQDPTIEHQQTLSALDDTTQRIVDLEEQIQKLTKSISKKDGQLEEKETELIMAIETKTDELRQAEVKLTTLADQLQRTSTSKRKAECLSEKERRLRESREEQFQALEEEYIDHKNETQHAIEDLKRELEDTRKVVHRLTERNIRLEIDIERLKDQSLEDNVMPFERESEFQLRQQLGTYKRDVEVEKEEHNVTHRQLDRVRNEFTDIRNELKITKSQLKKNRDDVKRIRTERTQMQTQLQETREQLKVVTDLFLKEQQRHTTTTACTTATQPLPITATSTVRQRMGTWVCCKCTYINSKTRATCEMCNTQAVNTGSADAGASPRGYVFVTGANSKLQCDGDQKNRETEMK